jgi:hypothetical protein
MVRITGLVTVVLKASGALSNQTRGARRDRVRQMRALHRLQRNGTKPTANGHSYHCILDRHSSNEPHWQAVERPPKRLSFFVGGTG